MNLYKAQMKLNYFQYLEMELPQSEKIQNRQLGNIKTLVIKYSRQQTKKGQVLQI
jgi:hypothetical protein